METFKIEIQEFLARVIEVKEKSIEDAFSKIQEQYTKAEIVLDYNDFVNVHFVDINTQSLQDEKKMLVNDLIDYLYTDEMKHYEEFDDDKPTNHIFLKLKRLKEISNE